MATGARVYDTDVGVLSNNVWGSWPFNSERWDYGGLHSTASNTSRLTAPSKGVYAISGHLNFANNATGRRGIRILLNGATPIAGHSHMTVTESGVSTFMSVGTLYELNTNDYVELQGYQNSGAGLGINNISNYSPEFTMHLVEAT